MNTTHTNGGGLRVAYNNATQPLNPHCTTPCNVAQPLRMEKYEQALRTIPAPGTGCHAALLGVANLGAIAGLSESEITGDIRANIPHGSRRVPDREIAEAVRKAIAECKADAGTHSPRRNRNGTRPQKARRPFDGTAYRQRLIKRSEGVSEADIWEASPYRLTWQPGPNDALHVLHALYAPTEILFIGSKYDKAVRTVADWVTLIEAGRTWPHIIANPVDGQEHEIGDGKLSRRCDAAVSSYRFALVEFDDMARNDQLAFWHSIIAGSLLPVALLVDAGKKSIHAWLRLDLVTADQWDAEVRRGLYDSETGRMALMGADRACSNPSRLSRLSGHHREGGSIQRLLYLNPLTKGAT